MGTDRKVLSSEYVPKAVALREQAITMADGLRLLDFSRESIVIELCAKYGYKNSEAARIVQESIRREPRPKTPGRKKRIR